MTSSMSIEDQILAALRRIIRAVDLHSRRLVEQTGLTGPQLVTLREAARLGSPSAGSLAKAANLSQATVTGILDRLERRGFIARTRSGADRRSVVVTVTDAGRAMLQSSPSLLQDQFCQQLQQVEAWEQNMILAILQRIAGMMEAEGIEAAPVLITGSVSDGSIDDETTITTLSTKASTAEDLGEDRCDGNPAT